MRLERKIIPCILLLFSYCHCCWALPGSVSFLAVDVKVDQIVKAEGDVDKRASPCSTFKIPLSLMGYDSGILVDETNPCWKSPSRQEVVCPQRWMKDSVVWYSQMLTPIIGLQKMKRYQMDALKAPGFIHGDESAPSCCCNIYWNDIYVSICPNMRSTTNPIETLCTRANIM